MPTKTTQKKPAPPPGPVADQGATLLVCIDDLYASPTNPRKTFDDTALAELAGSIRSVGLLQPLVVRKLAVGYEVVAGERRFRAAKLAGLSYLPCSVRELTDDEVCEVQLVENCQRADVHPMEEARALKAMQGRKAYADVASLASKIGRPAGYVARRLTLTALVPVLQERLETGNLTLAVAELAGRLEEKDQQAAVKEGWPLTSSATFARWRSNTTADLMRASFPLDDGTLDVEAGPCTVCPKNTANALFPDDQPACQDRGCFLTKALTHVARLKAHRPGLVEVSTIYSGGQRGLGHSKWSTEAWGDRLKAEGLVVESSDIEHVGHVMDVWVERPDQSATRGDGLDDQEKKARRKEEIRAHRVENAYRSRVWQALKGRLEVPGKGPESELVRLLAFALSTRGRSLAGTQVKHKGPRLRLVLEEDAFAAWRKFKESGIDGVADTIIDAFAAFEVGYDDHQKPAGYGLEELANICGVDTYQLSVEAEAEFPKKGGTA